MFGRKINRALIGLLAALLFLTGCDAGEAEADLIVDILFEWSISKDLITVEGCPPPYDADGCEYGINYAQIARWKASRARDNGTMLGRGLGRVMDTFGVEPIDPEVGAALDAGEVIYTMEQAEALAAEGQDDGDIEKIDQAIASRPGDWSYHDRRAALLLSQGKVDEAQASFDRAAELVDDRMAPDGSNCRVLALNMLRNREAALWREYELGRDNEAVHGQMQQTQQQLADLENNAPGNVCAP